VHGTSFCIYFGIICFSKVSINATNIFIVPAVAFHGIICCYAQFKVPLSWELSVAASAELGSALLTSRFGSLMSRLYSQLLCFACRNVLSKTQSLWRDIAEKEKGSLKWVF
jgi:hypothetical protein